MVGAGAIAVVDHRAPGRGDRAGAARGRRQRWSSTTALVVAALVARLALVGAPARADEAGYLMVAAAAHRGGRFLYGELWVDRPPLLVAFFATARVISARAGIGEVLAVRVLALVAVVVLVAAAVSAGTTLAGVRGGRWAGAVAGALAASPLLGAPGVDGEVLAAPLVMLAAAMGLRALRPPSGRLGPWRRGAALVGAGVVAGAAMLVKQNFADAAVLLVVLIVAGALRERRWRAAAVDLAVLAAGAGIALAAMLAWSWAWGPGPGALWEVMFGFRAAAAHVIASQPATAPARRAALLAVVALGTGLAAVLGVSAATGRGALARRSPLAIALGAMVAVAAASIAAGGSYWTHYLIELLPACALAAAWLSTLTTGAPRRAARAALVLVVASTVAVVGVQVVRTTTGARGCAARDVAAAATSSWLGDHARAGDSALTVYGGADSVLGTGLAPAYPYLWSLPVRVLDPDLAAMRHAVSGQGAATWVVLTLPVHSWGLDPRGRLSAALDSGYRPVHQVCDTQVLLRRDQVRPLTG